MSLSSVLIRDKSWSFVLFNLSNEFLHKKITQSVHLFKETFSELLEFKSFFNFRTEADACFNPNSMAAALFFSISSWSASPQSQSKEQELFANIKANRHMPWKRWSTESGIDSKSSGIRRKLPKTESNEPLLGAWQTGHSFEFTKQLWQEKCPQLVNEPGTMSPPGPQTRCSQIWAAIEANRISITIHSKTFLAPIWGNHFKPISTFELLFFKSWCPIASQSRATSCCPGGRHTWMLSWNEQEMSTKSWCRS